jgi:hypothetical protein
MDHTSAGGIRHPDCDSGQLTFDSSRRCQPISSRDGITTDGASRSRRRWPRLRGSGPASRRRWLQGNLCMFLQQHAVVVEMARHAGLRNQCGNACRFDFCRRHHIPERFDLWEILGPSSRRDGFDPRTVLQQDRRGQAKEAAALRSERSRSGCESSVPCQLRNPGALT